MDIFNIYVENNMMLTFVNMFVVVFALAFISNIAYILRGGK